jgi:hypothetical protein
MEIDDDTPIRYEGRVLRLRDWAQLDAHATGISIEQAKANIRSALEARKVYEVVSGPIGVDPATGAVVSNDISVNGDGTFDVRH